MWEGKQEEVDVWPEHEAVLNVWVCMSTQLNVAGMGGVIGYRYEALPVVMDMLGIEGAERRDVFQDFRVIEAEAIRIMREQVSRNGD